MDRDIAAATAERPDVRRLMSIPGVNATTAATLMAAIGDVRRFPGPRQLVSYLGLDPRVRQSGSEPARHGHISKQGARSARHALVEASWSAARVPGPLRAFAARIRARRGPQVATGHQPRLPTLRRASHPHAERVSHQGAAESSS